MATIFADSGRLYANISINGIRKKKSLGIKDTPKNRVLAESKLLPSLVVEVQTNGFAKKDKKVEDYWQLFIDIKRGKISKATLDRYEGQYRLFIKPKFEKYSINNLVVSDLKRWHSNLASQKSERTANMTKNLFKLILEEAVDDETIIYNPLDKVKNTKEKKRKEAKPFTKEEVKLILNSASGWLKNFLAISFFTGMRTGEAVALKWSDIDLHNKNISVSKTRRNGVEKETKTGEDRLIPVFPELVTYIEDQYKITGQYKSYVFLNHQNNPFKDGSRIRDFHWKRLLQKCNLEYRRLYDTRSTTASLLIQYGFNKKEVANITGHKDLMVLDKHYIKYYDDGFWDKVLSTKLL